MKILKIIFIVMVFLLALFFGVSAFLPNSYSVVRSTNIEAPMDLIYDQVNDFSQMQNWSPWGAYDTNMTIAITGELAKSGYAYSWSSKSKKLGNGSIIRKSTEHGKSIVNELLLDDYKMQSVDSWTFEQTPDGVKVTWGNSAELPLMSRFYFAIRDPDKIIGPDYESGLKLLKAFCEKNKAAVNSVENLKVEEIKYERQNYLAIHATADLTTIEKVFEECYPLINAEIELQKLKVSGPYFAIYYGDSQTEFDFDVAIPVNAVPVQNKKIKPGVLKEGKAIVAHYYGPYEGTGIAHQMIQKFIKENNKNIIGPVWEVYVTDPSTVKSPSEILTNIYYGID